MTKEEAKNYIGELKMYAKSQGWDEEYQIACDVAMNDSEQEPFINKSCVSSGVCEHDKNEVLDKIRAEIEQKLGTHGNISLYNRAIYDVLMIVDKYKGRSEE